MINDTERKALLLKLSMAMTASCSCMTKTNEPQYHDEHCLYRVLNEAHAALSTEAQGELGKRIAKLKNTAHLWSQRDDRRNLHHIQEAISIINVLLAAAPQPPADTVTLGREVCTPELAARLAMIHAGVDFDDPKDEIEFHPLSAPDIAAIINAYAARTGKDES